MKYMIKSTKINKMLINKMILLLQYIHKKDRESLLSKNQRDNKGTGQIKVMNKIQLNQVNL